MARTLVLYRRREEVLPETFASLIPPALPAPPIYEVMGDHGSPVEPPPASVPTWMPPAVSAKSLRCFAIRSLSTAVGGLRGVVVNDGSKYRIQKI